MVTERICSYSQWCTGPVSDAGTCSPVGRRRRAEEMTTLIDRPLCARLIKSSLTNKHISELSYATAIRIFCSIFHSMYLRNTAMYSRQVYMTQMQYTLVSCRARNRQSLDFIYGGKQLDRQSRICVFGYRTEFNLRITQ